MKEPRWKVQRALWLIAAACLMSHRLDGVRDGSGADWRCLRRNCTFQL